MCLRPVHAKDGIKVVELQGEQSGCAAADVAPAGVEGTVPEVPAECTESVPTAAAPASTDSPT
ncbi:hypothetical protein Taro_012360 [Colocasia esculenta]|uniref:Uncharacterized protein n=1 Tax=Colocasia esculenta TaxID=4460 RepID=A0A843U8H9_COLES|nr:hypothetical protein [Colocasia esculenta]